MRVTLRNIPLKVARRLGNLSRLTIRLISKVVVQLEINGFGQELDCTITHREQCATGMKTGGTTGSVVPAIIIGSHSSSNLRGIDLQTRPASLEIGREGADVSVHFAPPLRQQYGGRRPIGDARHVRAIDTSTPEDTGIGGGCVAAIPVAVGPPTERIICRAVGAAHAIALLRAGARRVTLDRRGPGGIRKIVIAERLIVCGEGIAGTLLPRHLQAT